MAEAQAWRAVLTDGSVWEVFVRFIEMTMSPGVMRWVVSSPSGRGAGFGDTRDEAISGWVRMNSDVRDILAPGEPTRAELAAQLATATASVQQLRADVELATAQRDAETCRADNTETERDEARAALAAVTAERDALRVDHRKMMDTHDIATNRAGFLRHIVEHVCRILDARKDETTIEAAQRVTRDIATATASVQQLRADVELATAQRDAETCRADSAEAQLAAVTGERGAEAVESDAMHDLIVKQAGILTAVADALKGTPPALMSHSHHDLGAVAAATVAQIAPLAAAHDALVAAARAAGWRDAGATPEEFIAWVRRGALREALAVARAEPGVPDGATQADFNATECAKRIAAGIEKLMGGE